MDAAPPKPVRRAIPDKLRALCVRSSRWFPLRGRARAVALFAYYLAILIGLILIYSHGNFATPTFIYQGF